MKNIIHGTWIAIADGAKALVLRNDGEADAPNFSVVDIFSNAENVRTSELGTERPGRTHESATSGRSNMAQTDWHDIGEQRFADEVANALDRHCQAGDFRHLIIVAPPRTLAELRHKFSKRLQEAIVTEVNKDLTNHPVYEIERILLAS